MRFTECAGKRLAIPHFLPSREPVEAKPPLSRLNSPQNSPIERPKGKGASSSRALRAAREYDDDPAPRKERPAGVLDQLAEGGQKLPDLRGRRERERVSVPGDVRTPAEQRRFARDRAILEAHLDGDSDRQIGRDYGLHHNTVSAVVDRMRALAHLSKIDRKARRKGRKRRGNAAR